MLCIGVFWNSSQRVIMSSPQTTRSCGAVGGQRREVIQPETGVNVVSES